MRRIVHWDGDGFFASIEQAADRRLRDRPVVVGGERRGLVLSASGEARRFGIHPGTPMNKARRMCPPLVVIPAHFDLYEQFGEQIVGLCEEKAPLIESVGVGAAWLDLTGTETLNGAPLDFARQLRKTVAGWLRVPLSVGLATNKTVARVAARWRKPHAPVEIAAGGEAAFLAPLPLRWLPGLASEQIETLEVAGLRRIGELAGAPLDALEMILGARALGMQRRAQGVDLAPVGAKKKEGEKSWKDSVEFAEDVWETARLRLALRGMLERVMAQVREEGVEIRRLTLGLRYTDREENERSVTLSEPTSLESEFYGYLPGLLQQTWDRRVRLRALWLKASRVYAPSPQLGLFGVEVGGEQGVKKEKEQRLAATMDRLKKTFGDKLVGRGVVGAEPKG